MNKERQLELLDKCETPLQREELENLFADFDAAGVEYDSIEIDLVEELSGNGNDDNEDSGFYVSKDTLSSVKSEIIKDKLGIESDKITFDIAVKMQNINKPEAYTNDETPFYWVFNVDSAYTRKNGKLSPFDTFLTEENPYYDIFQSLARKYRYPGLGSAGDSAVTILPWCESSYNDDTVGLNNSVKIGSRSTFYTTVLGSNYSNALEQRRERFFLKRPESRAIYGNIIAGIAASGLYKGSDDIISRAERLFGRVYPDFNTLCRIIG